MLQRQHLWKCVSSTCHFIRKWLKGLKYLKQQLFFILWTPLISLAAKSHISKKNQGFLKIWVINDWKMVFKMKMPAQLQPWSSQDNSIMSKPERSKHIPIADTITLFLTLWRRPYHQHSNHWKLAGNTQGVTRNSYEIEVTGLSNPLSRIAKGSIFCWS